MSITVIIPTYNRCDLLRKTLDGLSRQTELVAIKEVIVVNDGSTDGTRDAAEQFSKRLPIRVLEQSQSGVSRARNYGIREAQSDVVLFLDDDVIPGPHLVSEHAAFHNEMRTLEAVLMGYVTWHPEIRVTPFMRWYGEYGALFGFGRLKENQEVDPRYLYTCNISFKTEFLRANDGFNDDLIVLEDHELAYRLAQKGMRFFFRRAATGYHHQSFTFKQACERLSRYSAGLQAFLSTGAGQKMAQKRAKVSFRTIEAVAKLAAKAAFPLKPLVDSDFPLPSPFYRLFYWYYGTHLSFWSRVSAPIDTSGSRDQARAKGSRCS
jgi:glycosyltransferase involved in cell wall biosynthesis